MTWYTRDIALESHKLTSCFLQWAYHLCLCHLCPFDFLLRWIFIKYLRVSYLQTMYFYHSHPPPVCNYLKTCIHTFEMLQNSRFLYYIGFWKHLNVIPHSASSSALPFHSSLHRNIPPHCSPFSPMFTCVLFFPVIFF